MGGQRFEDVDVLLDTDPISQEIRLSVKVGRPPAALVADSGNVPVADFSARVLTWPTKPDSHDLDGTTHPGWMCAARVKRPECVGQVAKLVWRNAPARPPGRAPGSKKG